MKLLLKTGKRRWHFLALLWCFFATLASGQEKMVGNGAGGVGFDIAAGRWLPVNAKMPMVIGSKYRFSVRFADGRVLTVPTGNVLLDRFYALWFDLHDPTHGYFSRHDIPYHSLETFIVEAPDYGHLTTSEAISYWIWLEAKFAEKTGDLNTLEYAFDVMEKYIIPQDQPHVAAYQPYSPATYAPEKSDPTLYPVMLDQGVRPGSDPISEELKALYGPGIYGMHWLIDVDNWYGFGNGTEPTLINTFQRGQNESVWETVPHPSVDEFKFGAKGSGYLNLFTYDPNGYSKQWRYTNAPDADARVVQAVFGLLKSEKFKQRRQDKSLENIAAKTRKMGDFLRYATYDKYFKTIGCQSPQCPPGVGASSRHDLLGWYYAWGGSTTSGNGQWSWRIGSSHIHFGYQNPVAAYALSSEDLLKSPLNSAGEAWQVSLKKQKEFYQWLQSFDGAIAGGGTNSLGGSYQSANSSAPQFYGLVYEENPVYSDPGSNTWFGWQAWSMQRLVEYYLHTQDKSVAQVLEKWASWIFQHVTIDGHNWKIPAEIKWSGLPENWNANSPGENLLLKVEVVSYTKDIGITAALAKTLMQYAQALSQRDAFGASSALAQKSYALGRQLLEKVWNQRDPWGLSVEEVRGDYARYQDQVPIPKGFFGITPQGASIDQSSTFLSLRPQYLEDSGFKYVKEVISQGGQPVFKYHRFWAQVEAALAFGDALDLPY